MIHERIAQFSVNWRKRLSLLLVVALLPLMAVAPVQAPSQTRNIQSLLWQMAAAQPEAKVSVIVQKTVRDSRLEDLVTRLGGTVTCDLSIINAFAAEIKAADVAQLAQAEGVRWVSLDAPMVTTNGPDGTVNTTNLKNVYDKTVRADLAWAHGYQGSGIGVAVVDSGVNWQTDLYTVMGANRVTGNVRFNTDYNPTFYDNYGHGSHIAGIVGGNGRSANGQYIGIAPLANIVNVKVANDDGSATTASTVAGLQWVLNNRSQYNIRVVNLSLNSAAPESYHTSPLDAAAEILWFNGIVVIASAGNSGTAGLYPPANDPFVITVGAVDDKGTTSLNDDVVTSFSAYGTTGDGVQKPDLVAPGKNIVSLMGNTNGVIPSGHPGNKVGTMYFRMSGTSMSAPIVSGAVALLLEDEPNLNPDQVKYRLMATANKTWPSYSAATAGAGYLDIYAALSGTTTQTANTGITVSHLLTTGKPSVVQLWGTAQWGSAQWGSAQWGSAQWGSAQWGSAQWGSDYWGP
jgi:serine protease AprX